MDIHEKLSIGREVYEKNFRNRKNLFEGNESV